MHVSSKILFAVAIAVLSLATSRAEAAPQILGLVASNGIPTPMRCDASGCTALLASFCLQETREAPSFNQAYRPGPKGGFDLILARANGTRLTVAANALLTINLYEGLSTVQASLPLSALASRGVVVGKDDTLSLAVRDNTSILPVTMPNDPDPQTPEEISLATGPLRRLAAQTFDTGGDQSDTAKLLGLLMNALPPAADTTPVAVQATLDRIVAGIEPGRLSPQALSEAERIIHQCQYFPATALAQEFCIASQQRDMLAEMNEEYWDAAGGS